VCVFFKADYNSQVSDTLFWVFLVQEQKCLGQFVLEKVVSTHLPSAKGFT